MSFDYTVIIPVYDEEKNLAPLMDKVVLAMSALKSKFEILFVDDGSTDQSICVLEKLAKDNPFVTYISLSENNGQTVALQAGFDHARGERIVTIDGDLQMDPAYIPSMVQKMEEENLDLVYLSKVYQDVPYKKKFASSVANKFRQTVTGDKATDVGSNYKLYRENFFKNRNFCSGLHRFFTGFMEIEGFKMGYVKGMIVGRKAGVSKYTNWFRLKQGVGDLFYFYLYKNKRAAVHQLLFYLTGLASLVTIIPLPFYLKTFILILFGFLITTALSLTIHALHICIMRQRLPYQIKKRSPIIDQKDIMTRKDDV